MALGMVKRFSFIPLLASVTLAQGCFTTTSGDDDSSAGDSSGGSSGKGSGGSSTGGSTGGTTTDGCQKDTDCASPRICENHVCVNPSSGGSGGSTGGTTGGTGGSTGGKGGTAGGTTGGTGGTTGGTGGSTGGKGGTAGGTTGGTGGTTGGTGGTGGSSAGTGGACSADDPITCPSTTSMTLCVDGSLQTFTCDEACTTLGFEVGDCVDGTGCDCGAATDQKCSDGVNAFCTCVDGTDTPCVTGDPVTDPLTLYVDCHINDPANQANTDFLLCLADQVMSSSINCNDANTACQP